VLAGLTQARRFLRGPPPTCFLGTDFTHTSLLACSNSLYPPPKMSPLFRQFTKAAGCVCCPTPSLMYWPAAPPPSVKPLLIVSFSLKLFLERSVSSFPTELTWQNPHPAKSAVRTLGRRWPQATASSGLPPAALSSPRTFPTFCALSSRSAQQTPTHSSGSPERRQKQCRKRWWTVDRGSCPDSSSSVTRWKTYACWASAATWPPSSTLPMPSCSHPHGRACRWPSLKPWPWKNP